MHLRLCVKAVCTSASAKRNPVAVFWFVLHHVRDSGFWNPRNFCLWNPESLVMEFGIRNKIGIQNPVFTDKD